jgi:hypothetical protein
MKSGSLNLLEPSGPHRACYGTAVSLPLPNFAPASSALAFPVYYIHVSCTLCLTNAPTYIRVYINILCLLLLLLFLLYARRGITVYIISILKMTFINSLLSA